MVVVAAAVVVAGAVVAKVEEHAAVAVEKPLRLLLAPAGESKKVADVVAADVALAQYEFQGVNEALVAEEEDVVALHARLQLPILRAVHYFEPPLLVLLQQHFVANPNVQEGSTCFFTNLWTRTGNAQ